MYLTLYCGTESYQIIMSLSIHKLRVHSKITSHFKRRCIPPGHDIRWCIPSGCVAKTRNPPRRILAFSRLARRAPRRLKLWIYFLVNPKWRGQWVCRVSADELTASTQASGCGICCLLFRSFLSVSHALPTHAPIDQEFLVGGQASHIQNPLLPADFS